MDIESLKAEVSRREALAIMVDRIILAAVKRSPGKRVRRGVMHSLVADRLGLRLSSRMRTLVNERMEALGFRKSILHGCRFYSGLELLKTDSIRAQDNS